ncbi:MAG TPA: hypothetical protein VN957_24225 [Chthoniobacterales bacterium]|jgi:hypothetical protein|nr:hypothetical protein [Chthoniobacterales bacterium]
MKPLLFSLSTILAVVGTSYVARADDHHYYEHHERDHYEDRGDHDWHEEYWHHHHYGYWRGQRGYWVFRHHRHEFVIFGPG